MLMKVLIWSPGAGADRDDLSHLFYMGQDGQGRLCGGRDGMQAGWVVERLSWGV